MSNLCFMPSLSCKTLSFLRIHQLLFLENIFYFFVSTEITCITKEKFLVCSLTICSSYLLVLYNIAAELLLHRDLVILEQEIVNESDSRFSLFGYSKIREATDNFSKQNKLGEGGFGPVYQVSTLHMPKYLLH